MRGFFLCACCLVTAGSVVGVQMECFERKKGDIKCVKRESNIDMLYPTFLGISPPKSGSTSLHRMLSSHPNVVTGNKCLDESKCGYIPEVASLYELEKNNLGLAQVLPYFNVSKRFDDGRDVLAVGEKTPGYAFNIQSPYTAHAFFGPDLKLIYSLRDMVDEDISYYMHRRKEKSLNKVTFVDWVNARIKTHIETRQCKESALATLYSLPLLNGAKDWMKLDDLVDPTFVSWQDARMIEFDLATRCHFPSDCGNGTSQCGSIAEMNPYNNVRRWAHVFGENQLLCLRESSQERGTTLNLLLEKLASFLGLPPFPRSIGDDYIFQSQHTLELLYQQNAMDGVSTHQMDVALEKLKVAYDGMLSKEQKQWIGKFCPYL